MAAVVVAAVVAAAVVVVAVVVLGTLELEAVASPSSVLCHCACFSDATQPPSFLCHSENTCVLPVVSLQALQYLPISRALRLADNRVYGPSEEKENIGVADLSSASSGPTGSSISGNTWALTREEWTREGCGFVHGLFCSMIFQNVSYMPKSWISIINCNLL